MKFKKKNRETQIPARAICILSSYGTLYGFFEIGSLEPFAWAGFELRSSCSLPPVYLGLQM
jgi:hypothetical protein